MKKAMQLSALVIATSFLLSGCGKGGGTAAVPDPEPPVVVQNGVEGTALKGLIAGAAVTVIDADGNQLDVTDVVTADDGSYSFIFTAATVIAGIATPIQVIVDGTGATAVCDAMNADGSGDDCLNVDSTFSSFGETFTLPDDFQIRAILSTLPTPTQNNPQATVNPNPFTELATHLALAGGTTLTETAVDDANTLVLGIIQKLFPTIDVAAELAALGAGLHSIPILDITNLADADTANVSSLSIALAALSAAIAQMVDPDDADFSNPAMVMKTLRENLGDGVITNGDLAKLAVATARTVRIIVNELAAIDDVELPDDLTLEDLQNLKKATDAMSVAIENAPDDGVIDLDEPPPTTEELALAATKGFVTYLSGMIENLIDLADLDDDGAVTDTSLLVVFHDQFMWIAEMYGEDSVAVFDNLFDGIDDAVRQIKAGEDTVTVTGTSLSYTVTGSEGDDGSTFTVTEATSVSGNVTLTIASGTRTVEEAEGVETSGTFDATGVELVTTDGTATLQTFTGSIGATFTAEESGLGLTSLDMDGNVNVAAVTGGTAGGDWGVEIELTGLTGVVEDGDLDTVAGAYSGTFYIGVNGEDELIVTLSGTRANGSGTLDAYSLSLGDQTVIGSVTRTVDGNGNIIDTTTLADEQESVTLTLTVLLPATGSTSATGVFSSLGIQTGTMDETGHILFIDDTVQNLNASIFATPSDD